MCNNDSFYHDNILRFAQDDKGEINYFLLRGAYIRLIPEGWPASM
jgi:hypothetical protein